ncbi:hypothetical protein [uncultured Amphritea sp.]|uniref:hypothetical protein n=1 Tax=uncultured Amphritea sp. TaxID=981605 RepID=UPI002610A945|nr:hypothetical protein [uncultured Amphritea sp.]
MSLIATALLTAGPSLIRMAGELFGGEKASSVSEKLASAVEVAGGMSTDGAKAHIEQVVSGMPAEDVAVVMQLKVKLEEIAAEREKNQLNHQLGMHHETQETIRTEAINGTDYVKETRPKMARLSGYSGTAYVLGAELVSRIAPLFNHVEDGVLVAYTIAGASPIVAGVLYGPLFTYMGMRTVDAFSKWKQTPSPAIDLIKGMVK